MSDHTFFSDAIPAESSESGLKEQVTGADDENPLAEEEHEPCPTPLKWHEILQSFIQDANHWYLESPAGRILGRTWGTGPKLYFLNGLSGTHELYSLIVWLLREEYQCVLFDYPDTAVPTYDSLAELIPEVARLHDDTGPLTVITRDFGLGVVQHAALQHPGLIDTLICQTPHLHLPLSNSEHRLSQWGRRCFFKLKRLPGRKSIQKRVHRPWFPPFDPSRYEFYSDNTGEQITKAVSQRFLLNGTPLPSWTSLSFPERTLVIRTEGETPAQTQAAEELSALLPQMTVEWLHTSGQLAFLTHPHRVAKTIKEFLNPSPSSETTS